MRNIRQNLVFALAYNGIGIPIAAGALYPVLGWRLSPMIAAAAMALSSLSVVGNASRLRRYHPPATNQPGAGPTTHCIRDTAVRARQPGQRRPCCSGERQTVRT